MSWLRHRSAECPCVDAPQSHLRPSDDPRGRAAVSADELQGFGSVGQESCSLSATSRLTLRDDRSAAWTHRKFLDDVCHVFPPCHCRTLHRVDLVDGAGGPVHARSLLGYERGSRAQHCRRMHHADGRIVFFCSLVHDADEKILQEHDFALLGSGLIVHDTNAIVLHELSFVLARIYFVDARILFVDAGVSGVQGKSVRVHDSILRVHDGILRLHAESFGVDDGVLRVHGEVSFVVHSVFGVHADARCMLHEEYFVQENFPAVHEANVGVLEKNRGDDDRRCRQRTFFPASTIFSSPYRGSGGASTSRSRRWGVHSLLSPLAMLRMTGGMRAPVVIDFLRAVRTPPQCACRRR